MALPDVFLTTPIAHRGLHGPGVPENSLAAFQAAIDAGYGIELDIQHLADGTPLVFHDYNLMRLAGDERYVADMSADDLDPIRLSDSDQAVPTLDQVLRLVNGQVPLLVEIKDQDGRLGRNIGELQDRVAARLRDYRGPLAVMSFNPHTMAAFAKAAPDIARGLTTCGYPAEDWPMLDDAARAHLAAIADFDHVEAQFISHQHTDLESASVAAVKARGLPVLCWTIRSPEQERAARKIADNITFEGYRP